MAATTCIAAPQSGQISGTGGSALAVVPASFTSPNGPTDTTLRRLFGDNENNGTVDGADFAAFGGSFGSTGPGIPFDFDNNGTIDGSDFAAFGGRFGLTL